MEKNINPKFSPWVPPEGTEGMKNVKVIMLHDDDDEDDAEELSEREERAKRMSEEKDELNKNIRVIMLHDDDEYCEIESKVASKPETSCNRQKKKREEENGCHHNMFMKCYSKELRPSYSDKDVNSRKPRVVILRTGDDSDDDDSQNAPVEILSEFLSAFMSGDYVSALDYCKLILQYEPENEIIQDLYPMIEEKIHNEASVQCNEELGSGEGSCCSIKSEHSTEYFSNASHSAGNTSTCSSISRFQKEEGKN